MAGRATRRSTPNLDRLAELEEERRFLLRSLADLEREHAAGDVDEVDYQSLKDGYTVRAAATLRQIEEGRAALPPKPPVDWRRRIYSGVLVLALIALVSWALAASSAERKAGQQITGMDPRDEQQVLLAQARNIMFQSPIEAADLYGQVLEIEPDNVEALTYRGWTLSLAATIQSQTATTVAGADPVVVQLTEAVDLLLQATEIDPGYADPKCFLGIINYRTLGDAAAAKPWVDACMDAGPPADVADLVAALQANVDAELAGDGSTVPTTAVTSATSTTAP